MSAPAYRRDPEWQALRAQFVDEAPELSFDERLTRRTAAAFRMFLIEASHREVVSG